MNSLNLDAAIAAGELAIDGDSYDCSTDLMARRVIEAALPHILEAAARHIEAKRDWWRSVLALGFNDAQYFDVAARAVRGASAAPMATGDPITVPWASTPDGAGDSVHIDLSNEHGRYLIVSNAMYATPEQVREIGEACRAIAKLPAPEARPPRESQRPRRQTACTDGE